MAEPDAKSVSSKGEDSEVESAPSEIAAESAPSDESGPPPAPGEKPRKKSKEKSKKKSRDRSKSRSKSKEKEPKKEKSPKSQKPPKKKSKTSAAPEKPPVKDANEDGGSKPAPVDAKPGSKKEFNVDDHERPTVAVFYPENDLSLGQGLNYSPRDADATAGPGVTPLIEKLYGPCVLLSDFKYTTWADTVVPLRNHNIVQGFNEMALLLMKVAAEGGENTSHEDAFLAVSFLSNIRNDLGEFSPNVLGLIEHIDFLTKSKGDPEFFKLQPCNKR